MHVAVVPLVLATVVLDHVEDFVGFAQRFDARLADLQQAGDGDVVLAAAEYVDPATQLLHALLPVCVSPGLELLAGGLHGVVDSDGVRRNEGTQQGRVIDGAVGRILLALFADQAIDQVGPVAA
ncbi:hypothetical protein D9M71_278640 [compost metagenome]